MALQWLILRSTTNSHITFTLQARLPTVHLKGPRVRQLATVASSIPRDNPPNSLGPEVDSNLSAQFHRQSWSPPTFPSSHEFQLYTKSRIESIFARHAPHLDSASYRAAAEVFPMRVNNYVLENHIDWSNVPNDPIFQLTFPQPEMLPPDDLHRLRRVMITGTASRVQLRAQAEAIRARLNPHPAGQKEENVPMVGGRAVPGMQHKYRETVLFFPMEAANLKKFFGSNSEQGQFCHSFCTYCFRWAQFTSVGSAQQFQSKSTTNLKDYLTLHPRVSDVLFTGGDPMVMSSDNLAKYIHPILTQPTLSTVRIGTKSLAFWPHRYTTSPDALATLQLFSAVVTAGKHLTIQAHFSHPRELATPAVREAIRLIRMTGANIRCQSPLVRHVNNTAQAWAEMWTTQTRLGCIPYYMFVERDTGASHYFSVPLSGAFSIFNAAYRKLSGVARTVRGPSMSASPGKVGVVGIENIGGEKVFVLKFFQGRNPKWTGRTFFAVFDEEAAWLSDLKPAFGERKFFFEDEYHDIVSRTSEGSSGQLDLDEDEPTTGKIGD